MKSRIVIAIALFSFLTTSCEKEEITPSNRNPKENLRQCRNCDGNWDVAEPKGGG